MQRSEKQKQIHLSTKHVGALRTFLFIDSELRNAQNRAHHRFLSEEDQIITSLSRQFWSKKKDDRKSCSQVAISSVEANCLGKAILDAAIGPAFVGYSRFNFSAGSMSVIEAYLGLLEAFERSGGNGDAELLKKIRFQRERHSLLMSGSNPTT